MEVEREKMGDNVERETIAKSPIVVKTEELVESAMKGNDTSHDPTDAFRVRDLARAEGFSSSRQSMLKVELAALLHDIEIINPEDHSNCQDYRSNQNDQNTRFSPDLNQNPISERVQPLQYILYNSLRGVEQTDTNQKGAKNAWRVKEDVALMSAWCFVTEERIKNKNRKSVTLWAQVHAMFCKAQAENPEEIYVRNIESLKGRCKRITENANKWLAACQEAYRRKHCGMSQNDVEIEAHTIYYEAGGSKFQDLVVFNEVMSKHPKWELKFDHVAACLRSENEEVNEDSGGTSKRSRTTEDGDYSIPSNLENPSTYSSTMSPPIGRKTKQKGKGKTSQSSSTSEVAVEIRALRLTREKEVELMRSRLDLELKKLERNSMNMKEKMLNTLLAKDHLSPEDEDMKCRLMTIVFGL